MKELLNGALQKVVYFSPQTSFSVRFWDGDEKKYGRGPNKFKIVIRSEWAIKRMLTGGSLAFGEEYMAGNIEVEGDLQALTSLYDDWQKAAGRMFFGAGMVVAARRWLKLLPLNFSDKKNIRHHYDIGNDFYSRWLDPTMTYSCAYFKDRGDSLETAQNNKHEHICRKLRLKPGQTLADIGCGWGGMMFYATKVYGVKCVGYTLSENQYESVKGRIIKEDLGNQIEVYLDDYRKAKGSFDKFVSIGMFEHVAKRHYPEFFAAARRLLKPKGTGVLHTIGTVFDKPTDPWVEKYIFPGGFVPPLPLVLGNINKSGLVFYDVEDLRPHYGMTLDAWIKNFEADAENIRKIVVARLRDEKQADDFMRMWRLYLNGSAASFKNAGNRLYQVIFTNGPDNDLPLTRDYIYR